MRPGQKDMQDSLTQNKPLAWKCQVAQHLILDAAMARSACFCVCVQVQATRESLKCLPFLFGGEREFILAAAPVKYKHQRLAVFRSVCLRRRL